MVEDTGGRRPEAPARIKWDPTINVATLAAIFIGCLTIVGTGIAIRDGLRDGIAAAERKNDIQDQRLTWQDERIKDLVAAIKVQRDEDLGFRATINTKIDAQSTDVQRVLTEVKVISATAEAVRMQQQHGVGRR